jgi:hypothetical protein
MNYPGSVGPTYQALRLTLLRNGIHSAQRQRHNSKRLKTMADAPNPPHPNLLSSGTLKL